MRAVFSKSSADPVFTASNLCCVRQDRILFEAVNLHLAAGQLLQIGGKNGAGKSSLLRILAGLAQPDDGIVLWNEQPLADSDFSQHLCFIGHLSGIQPQLTALEHLEFWQASFGLKPADGYEVLAVLGLAGLEDVPCQLLSAGQQRRVSLARLWLTDRSLWILDEPFTALDQSAIVLLQRKFTEHLAQGGGIILTTHQPLTQHFPAAQLLELAYRW
ncbi:MAG: cytochrome c biogenesis heme-transporting ATPase CcmA [Rheinheimera sp.]